MIASDNVELQLTAGIPKNAGIESEAIPRCVGFIMDGNRKFSGRISKMPRYLGHKFGVRSVRNVLEWCRELGIRHVVIYAFSTENFNRPKEELEFLMNLFEKEFGEMITNRGHDVHKYRVNVKVIGNLGLLPESVRKTALAAQSATSEYGDYHVYVAMAYGGRMEIVEACKNIAKDVSEGRLDLESISEETVHTKLYSSNMPYPDLIIRTGGEKRISNFLLWQCAYSEFIFVDTCWPELTREEFLGCVREYQRRKRTFGV
jgi:tritrans,polycis-undecaprenyl-diphosphate synthase [geranylgeranyl-diphosphate specific]